MHLKPSSVKWWHFRLDRNALSPRQLNQDGGGHADNDFKSIFRNENIVDLMEFLLHLTALGPGI